MSSEDEFANRDAQGLTPPADKLHGDAAAKKARAYYISVFFIQVPAIQVALSLGTYLVMAHVLGMQERLDEKFAFLHDNDLGYVYLSIYIIGLARLVVLINANATRAGARVGRPCQHVYKVMDKAAPENAPFALMANAGWPGRFNRAQRALFNMDETLPALLVSTVLAAVVFGKALVPICLVNACGRAAFARTYTDATNKRMNGYMMTVISEKWVDGLVLFVAVKAIAGPRFPF